LRVLPLSPIVQFEQSTTQAEFRCRWALDDATLLLGSLADCARCVNPMRLVFLCGALAVAGYHTAAIIPRGAPEIERALRFTERHGCTWQVVIDEGVPIDHLHTLDIGVWSAPQTNHVPGLRVLERALKVNLPILATNHPASASICANCSQAFLVPPQNKKELTKRLVNDIAPRAAQLRKNPIIVHPTPDTLLHPAAPLEQEYRRLLDLPQINTESVHTEAA